MTLARKSKDLTAIVAISFILTVILFFIDESNYSFDFLLNPTELRKLLLFTIAFSVLPIAIYGFVGDRNSDQSLRWAVFGFSPPLIVLFWLFFA